MPLPYLEPAPFAIVPTAPDQFTKAFSGILTLCMWFNGGNIAIVRDMHFYEWSSTGSLEKHASQRRGGTGSKTQLLDCKLERPWTAAHNLTQYSHTFHAI